jgi:DHA1 family tetracycline resistance protein-like MFS transporter
MSPLVVIFFTVFIDLIGFGIIIPLLPFYAQTFGAGALTVGLLSTSFSAMQFVFAPVWGRLSDRVGRRPIILFGLFGSFGAYLLFGLAHSLAVLFISRIFAGIAAANIPTAQAFIADTTTPDNRAKGMGLVGAAFGLGFIFGPAIGGFLSRWGYTVPAFFASALSLANFVAAWFLLPESHQRGDLRTGVFGPSRIEALTRALTRPHLPVLLVVYFVVIAAFSGFETTFALFTQQRFGFTARTIGYSFAFVGIVLAVIQGGIVGRAVRRFGERRLVSFAILALTIGLALIPLARSVQALYVALGVLAVGMGFNGPSILSLVSRLSHEDDQGGIMGVSQSAASLARIAGPAWGGLTFDRVGITFPYFSSAVLMALAFAVSVAGLRGRLVGTSTTPIPTASSPEM